MDSGRQRFIPSESACPGTRGVTDSAAAFAGEAASSWMSADPTDAYVIVSAEKPWHTSGSNAEKKIKGWTLAILNC